MIIDILVICFSIWLFVALLALFVAIDLSEHESQFEFSNRWSGSKIAAFALFWPLWFVRWVYRGFVVMRKS